MMTPNPLEKIFKYFLDIRGIITEDITNAPTEWLKTTVEHARSPQYSGIIRTLTGYGSFVNRAAFLIRREYYQYLMAMEINFRIQKQKQDFTYGTTFTAKLDPSKFSDSYSQVSITGILSDFTTNIDAFSTTKFSIPLTNAINLELPPIALNETASLILNPSTDHRSNCFRDYTIVNNTQNSIDLSVIPQSFFALASPDFTTDPHWFYYCRSACNVLISGSFVGTLEGGDHYQINFVKSDGTIVNTIYDHSGGGEHDFFDISVTFNFSVHLEIGDRLFFYILHVGDAGTDTGIMVKSGEIDLSYQTSTPATMTQAISGSQLFGLLLQAMNANNDSIANLPVPFQSYLLAGSLAALYFTCSDSIRAGNGSLYKAGNTLGSGVYKVISPDPVTYNGQVYAANKTFPFNGTLSFTGTGYVQKIQSIYVGNVYNPGDSLQAGGTYLAEGNTGTFIVYNSVNYSPGELFKYVLGQDTFSVSAPSGFVKQVAIDPRILISFDDFFQCIKSVQGGNASFGIEAMPYLEDLSYVFRNLSSSVQLGDVSKSWHRDTAIDLMCNGIDGGYNTQQYDAINGFQETNAKVGYTTALLTPATKLNLVSPVRMDCIGIETIRVTQSNSAASRSDNDVIGVWINTTAISTSPFTYYRPLSTATLRSISGVDPSFYNFELSPRHNLERGAPYLNSIFYGLTGYQITPSSIDKNSAMVCTEMDGTRTAETDPFVISMTPAPLFIPIYDTITCGAGNDIPDAIDAAPYNPIGYMINGLPVSAFISNFKSDIGSNSAQELKLLLAPANNILKFIR